MTEIENFPCSDIQTSQFYQFPTKYRKHFNFGLNKNKNKRNSLLQNVADGKLSLKSSILGFSPKTLASNKHKITETLSNEKFSYATKNLLRYSQKSENSPLTSTSSEFAHINLQDKYKLSDAYYFKNSRSNEKLVDDKRYNVQQDSEWSPNSNHFFMRRNSQRSRYSSQKNFINPQELLHKHRFNDGQNICGGLKTPPSRRRSMSFSECCDIESPSLSEAHSERLQTSLLVPGDTKHITNSALGQFRLRNSIACKPKSKRARNLRRLSYNPIILNSSSSSSSETECDRRSVAQSEYDIRTKVSLSNRHRNSENPPFRRRTHSSAAHKVNHSDTNSLYGSNSSIKSAPQYNYSCDGLRRNSEKQLNFPIYDPNYHAANLNNCSSSSARKRFQHTCQLLSSLSQISDETAMTPELLNNFYTQLDVKKLSHKNSIQSLSTEVLSENMSEITKSDIKKYDLQMTPKESMRTKSIISMGENFQWPEKIHVPTGLSNNLKWLHKTQLPVPASQAQSVRNIQSANGFSNDCSSDTETDFCTEQYNLQMPPSPAP